MLSMLDTALMLLGELQYFSSLMLFSDEFSTTQASARSQKVSVFLILLACCREMGSARQRLSSLCSVSRTLLTSSRYLMRLSMRVGSNCWHASSLTSWIVLSRFMHLGANPKVSSQSQQQQARQVKNPKSASPILFPRSSTLSMDSATYSSYFISEQDPMKKAMPVKMRLNNPPTQERTVSILPMVLEIVVLLVDLQMLTDTYLVEEIDTELVWNPQMQLPVSSADETIGQGLLSVSRVYWAMLMYPTVPMVLVKAMKMFFSMIQLTATSS